MTWASHLGQLETERQQAETDRIVKLLASFIRDNFPVLDGEPYENNWKEGQGASAIEIARLERYLAGMEFPSDYRAFLRLKSGRDHVPFDSWHFVSSTTIPSDLLLHAIIGDVAYMAIYKELEPKQIHVYPMCVIRMDVDDRRCLVSPRDCREVANFWQPLLSDPKLPEKLRRDAHDFSTNHYGPIPILEKMKSWTTWLVLEQRFWNEIGVCTPSRIHPSFTHALEDMVTTWRDWEKDELEWEEARIAAWDRGRWEPFLASYAPSPFPSKSSWVESKRRVSLPIHDESSHQEEDAKKSEWEIACESAPPNPPWMVNENATI
ncbi:hypothetical protein F4821DRAFT_242407 [Hypoxylon rubiginosum]|uniref:Uncharacterized protein n=1 Tax=Hypoxylon rubiginosum TaxID=110542 RepID=A0ACC0CWF8_9PEZI|nr:hypothetical protein F4821DRAFT_242407 [Hypoxylon rubiginosum]